MDKLSATITLTDKGLGGFTRISFGLTRQDSKLMDTGSNVVFEDTSHNRKMETGVRVRLYRSGGGIFTPQARRDRGLDD